MRMDRRRFLKLGSAALAVALEPSGASAAEGGLVTPRTRLKDLRLWTSVPLDEMEHFYAEVLELKVLERDQRHLTVAAGETRLS